MEQDYTEWWAGGKIEGAVTVAACMHAVTTVQLLRSLVEPSTSISFPSPRASSYSVVVTHAPCAVALLAVSSCRPRPQLSIHGRDEGREREQAK
jgi:hypothetical protein